jgi:hypothetical protein
VRFTVDHLPGGDRRHGPWLPARCPALLLHWFDSGWVELYLPALPEALQRSVGQAEWRARTSAGPHHMLASADARTVLADPGLWQLDRPEGFVRLTLADSAPPLGSSLWHVDVPPAAVID